MIGSFRLTQIGEFQPTRIGVFRPTQFGEFHPTRTTDAFRLVVGNIFNAELAQNVLGVLHVIGEEFRFVGIASHREDTSAERPIESQDVTRGRRVLEAIVPARRVELDALAVLPEFLR